MNLKKFPFTILIILLFIFLCILSCQKNNEIHVTNTENNNQKTDSQIQNSERLCVGLKCNDNSDCGSHCYCDRQSNSTLGNCIAK